MQKIGGKTRHLGAADPGQIRSSIFGPKTYDRPQSDDIFTVQSEIAGIDRERLARQLDPAGIGLALKSVPTRNQKAYQFISPGLTLLSG